VALPDKIGATQSKDSNHQGQDLYIFKAMGEEANVEKRNQH
jgi:hypothetical protein